MNYITKRADGAPGWMPAAVLCRVRDKEHETWKKRYINDYADNGDGCDTVYRDTEAEWWRYAEPIESWQPQDGEIVAAWDNDDSGACFIVSRFIQNDGKEFELSDYEGVGSFNWNHVARLVYSDGRIIDCACSVDELKKRVGEGNWL